MTKVALIDVGDFVPQFRPPEVVDYYSFVDRLAQALLILV
jgi:hypothetical protein